MGPVLLLAILWIAFAGTHVWMSSAGPRARLVDRLGAVGFQGTYSMVALATFGPLLWIFWTHKHAGPLLWSTIGPPEMARIANYVLMAAALALLVCSLVPSGAAPSAMQARGPVTARGLTRVTRHPMLAAFGIFGIAHLLVNGNLGDIVFFAGFPLFAWIGGRHQDSRKVREVPGYEQLVATTSIAPFGAILRGRQRLVVRELPFGALGAGLAGTVLLRTYHHLLFGP